MKYFILLIAVSISVSAFSQSLDVLAKYQTAHIGGDYFKQENLTGKGIRIAVFDIGFPGVDNYPAFVII